MGTAGSKIAGSLEATTVARSAMAPKAVTDPAQIQVLYTTEPVYAGEQLSLNRFVPPKQQGVLAKLKGNQRAVQLSGDTDQTLAGTLQPGDRVDVSPTSRTRPTRTTSARLVALRNVRVLLTQDGEGANIDNPDDRASAVILAVTDEQAQRLNWVVINGDWKLQMRPVKKPKDGKALRRRSPRSEGRSVSSPATSDSPLLGVALTGDHEGLAELTGALESPANGIGVLARIADVREAGAAIAIADPRAVLHCMSWTAGEAAEASARETLDEDVAAIRRQTPAPIILLVTGGEPEVVEAALAAGVDDVVLLPQRIETIAFAVHKACQALEREGAGAARHRRGASSQFSPRREEPGRRCSRRTSPPISPPGRASACC